jgi:hypothetical protein
VDSLHVQIINSAGFVYIVIVDSLFGSVFFLLTAENGIHKVEKLSSAQSWVSAVAARKGSDLAASGAGNGLVRLWAIEPDSKGIRPIFDLKLVLYLAAQCYAECNPEK